MWLRFFLCACLVAGAWEVIATCLHLLFAHSCILKPFSSPGLQSSFIPFCFLSVFSVAINENRQGKCFLLPCKKWVYEPIGYHVLKYVVINSFELHFFLKNLNSICLSRKFCSRLSQTVKFEECQKCCLTV